MFRKMEPIEFDAQGKPVKDIDFTDPKESSQST